MVVLTYFVMCGSFGICVFVCTVFGIVYTVFFVLFRLCTFIVICFVCVGRVAQSV